MIIKSFEIINNIEIAKKGKIFFLYGVNFGLKKEIKNLIISEHKKLNSNVEIIPHEEDEILKEKDHFFNLLYIKSLFNEKRVLVISKISDKFLVYLESILEKEIKDVIIILISDMLDKKSKIRSMSEKEKQVYLIPCYEDSLVDLERIAKKELKFKNINYSNEIIAIIGDEWHAGNLSYHLKTRPKWFPRSVTDIRSPDYGKQFNHQFKNLGQGWVAVVPFGYECRGVSFDLPFFRLCMIDKI